MGEVIVGATMSLDGFINDRNGDLGPLDPDMDALHGAEEHEESIRTTGAVVMGRRAYDMAGLADRIDIYLAPLLLGGGLRSFEQGGPDPIRLQTISAKQVRWSMLGVTLVRYRPVA